MIDTYYMGDIMKNVKTKCISLHGGWEWQFFGIVNLSSKAQEEYDRIMKLPISEILEFLK